MTTTYMAPGMSGAEYHAHPAFSSGFLKRLKQSPMHADHARRNPPEPTAAMTFGTALHTALLEPGRFAAEYVTMPEGLDRRTKEGKALYAELIASGRATITHDESEMIAEMIRAAHTHPEVPGLLRDGLPEPSIFTTLHGQPVKVRPDLFLRPCAGHPGGLLVDVKTTGDASPAEFGRTAWRLGYHIQAALYVDAVHQLTRAPVPPDWMWLAIERDAPHGVALYSADPGLIEIGRREVAELLELAGECTATGIWPGYPTDVEPLQAPAWAMRADSGEEVVSIGYVAGGAA